MQALRFFPGTSRRTQSVKAAAARCVYPHGQYFPIRDGLCVHRLPEGSHELRGTFQNDVRYRRDYNNDGRPDLFVPGLASAKDPL